MKRMKRWLGIMMSVMLAAGSLQVPVYAVEAGETAVETVAEDESVDSEEPVVSEKTEIQSEVIETEIFTNGNEGIMGSEDESETEVDIDKERTNEGGYSEEVEELAPDESSIHTESEETLIEEEGIEDNSKTETDSVTSESIAQAIWTAGNYTLTFYYGPQVSEDDTFNGATVARGWSGTDVMDSGSSKPWWNDSIHLRVHNVVFDESFLKCIQRVQHSGFMTVNI